MAHAQTFESFVFALHSGVKGVRLDTCMLHVPCRPGGRVWGWWGGAPAELLTCLFVGGWGGQPTPPDYVHERRPSTPFWYLHTPRVCKIIGVQVRWAIRLPHAALIFSCAL